MSFRLVLMSDHHPDLPLPKRLEKWQVGTCRRCGGMVVSNTYWSPPHHYQLVRQCWRSLGDAATCQAKGEVVRRWSFDGINLLVLDQEESER